MKREDNRSPRSFTQLIKEKIGVEIAPGKEEQEAPVERVNFEPMSCEELSKILGITIKFYQN